MSKEQCKEYGGILHPNQHSKCCASSCGNYCGSEDCEVGVGGSRSCCGTDIKDELICEANVLYAPCTLGIILGIKYE